MGYDDVDVDESSYDAYYNDTTAGVEYYENEEQRQVMSVYFALFAVLLVSVLVLSKYLHHWHPWSRYVSEAALVLMVGMVVGFIVDCIIHFEAQNATEEEADMALQKLLSFSSNVFFLGLLPPIMFNSGYQLQRELFYRHLAPITLFALLGTTVSALGCAFLLWSIQQTGLFGEFSPTVVELLAFGSLIAATDTVSVIAVLQKKRVDPRLFYLVFGESALNDAVALVLFNIFADILRSPGDAGLYAIALQFAHNFALQAIGSPILGITFGALVALIFKKVDLRSNEFCLLELSIFLVCMYLPFIIAECLELSGIVSIFFCGLSIRRYASPNVSEYTRVSGESIFRVAAFLAETCIFLELGMSFLGFTGSFYWGFAVCALVVCLVGRALAIYPLSYAYNVSLRRFEIGDDDSISSELSVQSSGSDRVESQEKGRFCTPLKRKDKKISAEMAHILWFAGLRGAVAYACVREFPKTYGHDDEFTAATMFIILFTIIIMGGAVEPLLDRLGIQMGVDEEEYMFKWRKEHELKGTFHQLEEKFIYQVVTCQDNVVKPDYHLSIASCPSNVKENDTVLYQAPNILATQPEKTNSFV